MTFLGHPWGFEYGRKGQGLCKQVRPTGMAAGGEAVSGGRLMRSPATPRRTLLYLSPKTLGLAERGGRAALPAQAHAAEAAPLTGRARAPPQRPLLLRLLAGAETTGAGRPCPPAARSGPPVPGKAGAAPPSGQPARQVRGGLGGASQPESPAALGTGAALGRAGAAQPAAFLRFAPSGRRPGRSRGGGGRHCRAGDRAGGCPRRCPETRQRARSPAAPSRHPRAAGSVLAERQRGGTAPPAPAARNPPASCRYLCADRPLRCRGRRVGGRACWVRSLFPSPPRSVARLLMRDCADKPQS